MPLTRAARFVHAPAGLPEPFAAAFRAAPVGMALEAPDARRLAVNAAFCAMLGRDEAELLAGPPGQAVHADDLDGHVAMIARVADRRAPEVREQRYLRADGSEVWCEVHAAPVEADDGAVAFVVCHVQDVDARRRREAALQADVDDLAQVVAVQQAVLTARLEPDAIMSLVAGRVQRLTGADGAVVELAEGDEMVYAAASGTVAGHVGLRLARAASLSGTCVAFGRTLRCDDTEQDPRVDRAACRRIGARALVCAPLLVDGEAIGVLKVLAPEPHGFGAREEQLLELMAGFIAAAVAGARAETRRITLIAELERSNEDLAGFARAASHDLREPLALVTGYLGLLADHHGAALDAQARGLVEEAMAGARRMQRMIADMLVHARLNGQLRPEPVDLGELVAETVRVLEPAVREAGAWIEVGPLPRVTGDRTQLGRLVQNLLANALKFRGDLPPRIRVGGGPAPGGGRELVVTDNGIGIPPAEAERVFGLFERVHAGFEGTGIGLASCRRIAERHGGTIRVEPAPAGGSAFRVTLPG